MTVTSAPDHRSKSAVAPLHVIITGGSSGIGAAIADVYAERGANISLIARTASALADKKRVLEERFAARNQHFRVETADVRDWPAIGEAVARCEHELGPCDILIVSSGIVDPAPFDVIPADRFNGQIETNLLGSANAVRAVFAGMRQRRRGRILMIGSGAGLIGLFGYTAYCASKAGLIGFAEALRQEARPHGISVSICLPPDTDTPQLAMERRVRPSEASAIIGAAPAWSAGAIARVAIRGLDRGKAVTHPGLQIKFLAYSRSVLAPLLRHWFDRRIAGVMRGKAEGDPH